MFSLMGNCFSCIKKRQEPRKEFTLAILGVDNAGKTTATKGLIGDPLETAPTVGFNSEKIKFGKFDITLFDLGGGVKIRDIWKNYYEEVYGIIYVVDASCSLRMEETQSNLNDLLQHKQVSGKPLLILANKQDVKDALDEVDICQRLGLEELVNKNRCPCKIETCSALKGTGKKMDKNIKKGIKWIATFIDHHFESLEKRIQADKKVGDERRKKEKEERRKRVEAIRKEREEKEAAEREKLGIENDEKDEDMIDGDPFKRLDLNELNKKDKRLKAEKKKKKQQQLTDDIEFENRNNHFNAADNKTDDFMSSLSTPRTKRRSSIQLESQLLDRKVSSKYHDRDYNSDDCDMYTSKSTPNGKLPPLQSQIGTKTEEEKPARKVKKKKQKQADRSNLITEDLELNDSLPMSDSFMASKKSLRSVSKINVETRDDESSQDDTNSVTTPHYTSRTEDGNGDNMKVVKPPRKKKNKRFQHRIEANKKSDMGSGSLSIGSGEIHNSSRFLPYSEKDDLSEASSTNLQLRSNLNRSTLPPVEPMDSPYKRNIRSFNERFPVDSTQDMYKKFKNKVQDVSADVHSSPARSIQVKSLMLEEDSGEELVEKRSDLLDDKRHRPKNRFKNHKDQKRKEYGNDDDDDDIIVGHQPTKKSTAVGSYDRNRLTGHKGYSDSYGDNEYTIRKGADSGMRNWGFAEELDIDTRLSARQPNADCEDDIIT